MVLDLVIPDTPTHLLCVFFFEISPIYCQFVFESLKLHPLISADQFTANILPVFIFPVVTSLILVSKCC